MQVLHRIIVMGAVLLTVATLSGVVFANIERNLTKQLNQIFAASIPHLEKARMSTRLAKLVVQSLNEERSATLIRLSDRSKKSSYLGKPHASYFTKSVPLQYELLATRDAVRDFIKANQGEYPVDSWHWRQHKGLVVASHRQYMFSVYSYEVKNGEVHVDAKPVLNYDVGLSTIDNFDGEIFLLPQETVVAEVGDSNNPANTLEKLLKLYWIEPKQMQQLLDNMPTLDQFLDSKMGSLIESPDTWLEESEISTWEKVDWYIDIYKPDADSTILGLFEAIAGYLLSSETQPLTVEEVSDLTEFFQDAQNAGVVEHMDDAVDELTNMIVVKRFLDDFRIATMQLYRDVNATSAVRKLLGTMIADHDGTLIKEARVAETNTENKMGRGNEPTSPQDTKAGATNKLQQQQLQQQLQLQLQLQLQRKEQQLAALEQELQRKHDEAKQLQQRIETQQAEFTAQQEALQAETDALYAKTRTEFETLMKSEQVSWDDIKAYEKTSTNYIATAIEATEDMTWEEMDKLLEGALTAHRDGKTVLDDAALTEICSNYTVLYRCGGVERALAVERVLATHARLVEESRSDAWLVEDKTQLLQAAQTYANTQAVEK